MYEFITGNVVDISPTHIILENQGIGYNITISLETYSELKEQTAFLFIHQLIREDSNTLYGFYSKQEREFFRHLITVPGIGASTTMKALACASWKEIAGMIASSDVNGFKKIKGVGPKTANQIIITLKDKIEVESLPAQIHNPSYHAGMIDDAEKALVALGFPKAKAKKACEDITKNASADISVESIIKAAIKLM